MLTVAKAIDLISQNAAVLASRSVPLAEALGCRLAETIASDVDSPPHDKSIVDGYAIRCDDLVDGRGTFRVIDEITAGRLPRCSVEPGTASRIMTGAPLPAGADAVVMVERSTLDGDCVTLDDPRVRPGQNIARRGKAMQVGDIVLRPDSRRLNPAQIGLLAEVGRTVVRVVPRPRVAILSTGDELVEPHETPGPGQIRNSNASLLAALVTRGGGVSVPLGIARDDRDDLRQKIAAGLAEDMLLLSGGVSAGVLDLVPSVLAELGVIEVFHKVRVKPGKPVWFGMHTAADGARRPVFGLPGNPVSTLVCYALFVQPALGRQSGELPTAPDIEIVAKLTAPFEHRGDRPTFWPARLQRDPQLSRGEDRVTPLVWHGSGDLRTIAEADCFIAFPPGDRSFSPGETVAVRHLVL